MVLLELTYLFLFRPFFGRPDCLYSIRVLPRNIRRPFLSDFRNGNGFAGLDK